MSENVCQRALPQTADRPAPARLLRPLCAPGYTGRKRGEVVRTRTVVLQAHTHQWLATFGHAGNGQYRVELRQALSAIKSYLSAFHLPLSHALVCLDGHYGTKAVLLDLADRGYVTRGKDYHLLDQPAIQARLTLPPDQQLTQPESGIVRTLFDCSNQPLDKSAEKRSRAISEKTDRSRLDTSCASHWFLGGESCQLAQRFWTHLRHRRRRFWRFFKG